MITKVAIVNFEKIKEFKADFYPSSVITGKNGTGKTAIARAIAWCLTGKDIDGQANATRYLGKEKGGTTVTVTVDGIVYERHRTKTKMLFSINGEPAPDDAFLRKNNLTAESFLILFFPGFFLKMNELKQREVFTACAPEVDEKALLKEILGDVDFELTEPVKVAHKNFNDLKIQYEKRLATLKGRTQVSIEKPDQSQIDELDAKRNLLAKEIEAIDAAISAIDKQEKDYMSFVLKQTQYDMVLKQREEALAFNALNQAKRDEQKNEPEFREHLKQARAKSTKVGTEVLRITSLGHRLRAELEALKRGENCPTCGAERKPDPQTILDIEKQLAEARIQYVKADAEVNAAADEQEELEKICAAFAVIPSDKPVPAMPEKPALVSKPDFTNKPELLEAKKRLGVTLSETASKLYGLQGKAEIYASMMKNQAGDADEIASTEKALEKAEKIAAALHPKTGLPSLALKKRMERVSIPNFQFHFTETLKNGDERECFHITREDGIGIDFLSSGEQIKFCVELSRLMANLTNTDFNTIFLERDDLVDIELKPEGFQVLREKVSEAEVVTVCASN